MYNISVGANLVLIDNRLVTVQIPKNISLERLDEGSPLVLATAKHGSDSEPYGTHSMDIELNVNEQG